MGLEQPHKQKFKMKSTCTTKKRGRFVQVERKRCKGFSKDNFKHKLTWPTTFGKRPHSAPYNIF
jgi:hypothetical protein